MNQKIMNNSPQFKVYGIERRKLKKELSLLKSFVKNFWYFHQLDVDMASFYGGNVMSDERAQAIYNNKLKEIEELEKKLFIPYEK